MELEWTAARISTVGPRCVLFKLDLDLNYNYNYYFKNYYNSNNKKKKNKLFDVIILIAIRLFDWPKSRWLVHFVICPVELGKITTSSCYFILKLFYCYYNNNDICNCRAYTFER